MSAMDFEQDNGGRYDDEPRYERDRSASPRGAKRDDGYRGSRQRSGSAGGGHNGSRGPAPDNRGQDQEEIEAANTGTNLFVTGIAPRLNEEDITRMFSKYGEVKHCAIMKDPHSQESRGFGFVEMLTPDQAEAARDGLSGENFEGRTLSIEKARRARPRTPTPGRYFGPPKKEDRRDGGGGRFNDRRGFGGRYDRRDDRGQFDRRNDDRRDDRYEDRRGYGRRDDRHDDRRGGDRYASRDDRYGRDDRRGGDDRRDRDRDRGDNRGARYDNAGGEPSR